MSKAAELARLIGDGTFGTGGAEDKKIVFDGNAQDFHIGLDDSADDLVIGLGSALGTTTHMSFDENGQILKPLQCYFNVRKSTDQSNIDAGGSDIDVAFGTEVFDTGGNFASNTFTAPVTGKYFLYTSLRLDNVDTAAAYYNAKIITSNRDYRWIEQFNTSGGDYNYFTVQVTAIADMDAGDTAKVQILQNGGTAQTDVREDSTRTYFSGYLLG
tara:strand:+ start:76 stop:717 length:642 start_codon:yes stop_codon:yes gene_type:complete